MSAAGLVLACAIELLGRRADQLPRIELLDHAPPGVSANAAAFADRRAGVIYLIASMPPLKEAFVASQGDCRDLDEFKLVASILAHEEWHLLHGDDEEGAYEAQLRALQRLGAGSRVYFNVQRAMLAVLEARAASAAGSLRASAR